MAYASSVCRMAGVLAFRVQTWQNPQSMGSKPVLAPHSSHTMKWVHRAWKQEGVDVFLCEVGPP